MGGTFASAENGVAFEAWQGAGGVGFRELPNGFFSVYSDSGANKTGGLNFIRSEFEKAEAVFSASSVVTGFTVEGLRAAMADNRGNATIMVDEAKNFYAAMTQYASRGSDSAEKFLELLNGVSQKTVMLGTRCRGPSVVCARCAYNPPRPPSVSIRSISTPTSEEQSADSAGSRSWTRRARSGTPGGKWCMPLRSATSSSSVFRGYRFAANSVTCQRLTR